MVIVRRPQLITFDVFGTLFRVEEIASLDLMEEITRRNELSITPPELAQIWWDKSYEVAHENFVTVKEATEKALSLLLEEVGAEDDPKPYTARLLESWATTEVYPEVPVALESLEGFTLGIVSNIDDYLLGALLSRSGLKDRFGILTTSEACRSYKPDPSIFQEALRVAGCDAREALHLGDTPVDDVLGPKRVGMMAGWVNRRGEEFKARIPEPDIIVGDLMEAAKLILRT